jgi:DNA-binding transcriptional LysR family regulator
MDLKDFAVLQAAATYGSATAAVRHLNTVQSNLTARIRQLEEHLSRCQP